MKTLVIEDKEQSRLYLESLIEVYSELEYLGHAETVKEGVNLISVMKPELVLFDIELPDGDSFDILKQLKNQNFKIVFVSSYDSYAIKAFQYNAIDYLLKPVEKEVFNQTITKALGQQKLENQEEQLRLLLQNITFPKVKQKKIVLNTTDTIHIIQIEDIVRLESDNNYTYFHMVDKRKIMVSISLKTYENLLKDRNFFRIHQSHIINMKHLLNYNKKAANVLMFDESMLPVSVRKQPIFMKLIKSLK